MIIKPPVCKICTKEMTLTPTGNLLLSLPPQIEYSFKCKECDSTKLYCNNGNTQETMNGGTIINNF